MCVFASYNKLIQRINKAEIYMNAPYDRKLQGKDLAKAVAEREKQIPRLLELMKEANDCLKIIKKI